MPASPKGVQRMKSRCTTWDTAGRDGTSERQNTLRWGRELCTTKADTNCTHAYTIRCINVVQRVHTYIKISHHTTYQFFPLFLEVKRPSRVISCMNEKMYLDYYREKFNGRVQARWTIIIRPIAHIAYISRAHLCAHLHIHDYAP